MVKIRKADTIEDCINKIVGDITVEVAASLVDRTTSLIRKWSDPDIEGANPSYSKGMDLAIGYATITGKHSPLFELLLAKEKEAIAISDTPELSLIEGMLDITIKLGSMSEAVSKSMCVMSENGESISPNESNALWQLASGLEDSARSLKTAIKQGADASSKISKIH